MGLVYLVRKFSCEIIIRNFIGVSLHGHFQIKCSEDIVKNKSVNQDARRLWSIISLISNKVIFYYFYSQFSLTETTLICIKCHQNLSSQRISGILDQRESDLTRCIQTPHYIWKLILQVFDISLKNNWGLLTPWLETWERQRFATLYCFTQGQSCCTLPCMNNFAKKLDHLEIVIQKC